MHPNNKKQEKQAVKYHLAMLPTLHRKKPKPLWLSCSKMA